MLKRDRLAQERTTGDWVLEDSIDRMFVTHCTHILSMNIYVHTIGQCTHLTNNYLTLLLHKTVNSCVLFPYKKSSASPYQVIFYTSITTNTSHD